VTVVEKETSLAAHQTGRNSGVVHAGIYYAAGSVKADLCRRGVGLLRELCAEHDLPFQEIGKLVVAVNDDEVPRLEALAARAQAAGVPGLERLGPEGIRDREPNVVGHAALWSPTTAITDFAAITRAMATEVTAGGGAVLTGAEVTGIDADAVALADGRRIPAERVVICAGLQTDRVSRLAGGSGAPRIVPFRGEYLRLRPGRTDLVHRLVYPVPDPQYPFLGVHFTPRVSGAVDVGPNAVLALAREGYRWRDVSPRDLVELARFPGTWRLTRQHWRTGAFEVRGSVSRHAFARRAQAYAPSLEPDDLVRAPAGVRAQAVDRDGSLVDDFVLVRHGNVLSVRNAPSPGATSSLAIAEHIVDTL
jgi:L-2-hydroxyglutarate oxidase LhgO